jgi:hypothetical protein
MAKFGGPIVDRFSAGLDDLSRKDQADSAAVLRVLKRTGKFSVFEASENQTIADTMTRIMRSGWVETLGGEYPWTAVRVTQAGDAFLAACGGERPNDTRPDNG